MKKDMFKIRLVFLVYFVMVLICNLFNLEAYAYSNSETEDLTYISLIKSKASEIPISVQSEEFSLKAMSVNESETNLIVNGNFEMDPSSYGSWFIYSDKDKGDATYTWDSQIYHGDSGHSVKIQGDSVEAFWNNNIQIQPGKEYSFSAWGKALNVTNVDNELGSFIYTEQLDVNGEYISGTGKLFTANTTFDWMEADFSFVADQNADSIFIMLGLSGSGTVWYDDISLSIVPTQSQGILLPASAFITDTVMHESLPVMYAVDNANSKVYAVNYENKTISEINFVLQPERITYSNGKLYVTLLKAPHSSYTYDGQQEGAIAVIDAANFSLIKQIDVDTDPFDVVVSGDIIYIPSGSGQWTDIKSYSETTKQLISSSSIRQQSYAELNPTVNKIYTVTTDSSPRDHIAYDINNGIFLGSNDSPYHGDYFMSTNFSISPDGKYVFNGSGLILTCDADDSKDLHFVFKLDKYFNDVAFDIINNKFYTGVSGKMIYEYNYDTFEGINTYCSEGDISNLYYRDGELIALSKIDDSQYIVEKIDINGETEPTPTTVNIIQLQLDGDKYMLNYIINDSIIDPENPIVYITDSTNKKIASINYETGIVKELSTYYAPGSIEYYNNELIIGYGNQGKIAIYDAHTLELKDTIYTEAVFFDMTVGNDGFIYTTSDDYARSYSRESKQEVSKIWVFEKGYLEVHPMLNNIYMTSLFVSPADLYALNYSSGNLTKQYDSPYHGSYAMASNNRISPDGKYIFNGSGNIFISSSEKSQDIKYFKKLNKAFYDVAFDLENNRFYAGVSGNFIYVYNYSTFQGIDTYLTQGNVKNLYLRNEKIISISGTSQGKDMIEFIDTAPNTNIQGKPNNILIKQYSPSSCSITWETDERSSSQVEYGLTQNYGSMTEIDPILTQKHSIVINHLSPNTVYHFKILSEGLNGVNIVSDDIIFYTKDLPSINLGTAVNRIIFDASLNKAYAIDNTHMKILVVDLSSRILEKEIVLSSKPSDLCLSEDATKLYIVNYDGTVSEFEVGTFDKVRDIASSLPQYDSASTHFHIKCKLGKLYLVDGAWAPTLWILDLDSLILTEINDINSIGDIVFSKNDNDFYFWHQYGWSAGWAGSYIHKYLIEDSNITNAGTSNSNYPTGMDRDPLDTPIILLEEQNKIICKNKVFDTESLSEIHTFDENIYGVSKDGTLALGKSGIYSVSDYTNIAETVKESLDIAFFDNNRCLYYVVNEQSRIYYDSGFMLSTEVTLNKSSTTIKVGDSEQLTANIMPFDGSDNVMIWSVYSQSSENIVTVSQNGLVQALNQGTALVRATSSKDNTKYSECSVTVIDDNNISISGRVYLEGINGFAGGAQIILVDQLGNEIANCTTSYSGEFIFNQTNQNINLKTGVYGIIVSKPLFLTEFSGYFSAEHSLELNSIELHTGDLNQDNIIDIYDIVTLAKSIGKQSTCNNQYEWYPTADLNRDNEVSITDLAIMANNYGRISYKKQ